MNLASSTLGYLRWGLKLGGTAMEETGRSEPSLRLREIRRCCCIICGCGEVYEPLHHRSRMPVVAVKQNGKTKSKPFPEEKRQKPKAEFGDCVYRLGHVPRLRETTGRESDGGTGLNENAQHKPSQTIAPRECGWKHGDSGDRGEKKKLVKQNEKRIDLTPTGLLMEVDYTSLRRLFAFPGSMRAMEVRM